MVSAHHLRTDVGPCYGELRQSGTFMARRYRSATESMIRFYPTGTGRTPASPDLATCFRFLSGRAHHQESLVGSRVLISLGRMLEYGCPGTRTGALEPSNS